MTEDVWDVVRSGSSLVDSVSATWLTPQEVSAPLVIFVHGFTSHGRYLSKLAHYVRSHGHSTALFNYDSYRGIDVAALDLESRLKMLAAPIAKHGYAIVAHSMGGLVALQHALESELGHSDLRGIVLLGSPCTGTLRDKRVVHHMLDWAEHLTGPNPFARTVGCKASLQLTGNDSDQFLKGLELQLCKGALPVPALSISGGMNFLEFGKGKLSGTIRNMLLQRLIDKTPNDGLVAEVSADISQVCLGGSHNHQNTYSEFNRINHTFLTQNQNIAELVVDWLRTTAFP